VDGDVGGLTLEAAQGLVDQDRGVRQREALALRPRGQQKRTHARRHAHAQCRDVGLDELHRIVDREPRSDRAARRVDVEVDLLVGVFRLQKQHLRHDEVCGPLIDRSHEKHDALLEQPRVDVVGSLAASALLDHHRDQAESLRFVVPALTHRSLTRVA